MNQSQTKLVKAQEEINLPVWSVGYLLNGNESGLNDSDLKSLGEFNEWLNDVKDVIPYSYYLIQIVEGQQPFFTKNPFFGKHCDCYIATVNFF